MILFPFQEYWWVYAIFIAFVLVVLVLDLGVFHKKAHEVSFREATTWTFIWIGLAIAFNFVFYKFAYWQFTTNPRFLEIPEFNAAAQAKSSALEFLTGFVVEKTLAIDNIFIFAVVFGYFGIPKIYQHRVLFWGILGALIFRALFIAAGSLLMHYEFIVMFFGGLLIFTAVKMFFASAEKTDLDTNFFIKLLQKLFRIHGRIEGQKFYLKIAGLIYVTPLFIALIFLELTDIIFAIDSVPAIFALTKEPLIVFTSNIFAILGLRSMYFILAGALDKFAYIKYGLASILLFVGSKMIYLNKAFDGKFPVTWSLAIIAFLIGSSIVASLIKDARK